MTEEQVKTWIDFLKTNPPKARCRFRDGNACCAIGYALELFRPLKGHWERVSPFDTDEAYTYHYKQFEAAAYSTLDERLLEALGLDWEIEEKIAEANDSSTGWSEVIKVIERELA